MLDAPTYFLMPEQFTQSDPRQLAMCAHCLELYAFSSSTSTAEPKAFSKVKHYYYPIQKLQGGYNLETIWNNVFYKVITTLLQRCYNVVTTLLQPGNNRGIVVVTTLLQAEGCYTHTISTAHYYISKLLCLC